MSRIQLYDAPGGDTVTLHELDNGAYKMCTFMLTPDQAQENLENIRNCKCREDDVFLNSYPKTGTNWLWDMIRMALTKRPELTSEVKLRGMLEALPAAAHEQIPSPRILNTHLKVKYLPQESKEKKIKCILLCRNPKDVAVSFYNHTKLIKAYNYDGKWENFLTMFMRGDGDCGSYPEYLREWQEFIKNNPDWPVHIVYYEDLKLNCFSTMKKLCQFLDLGVSDELISAIVDASSIDKMRDIKTQKAIEDGSIKLFKTMLKEGGSMYRKGQIGDWKNWFSVAQNEQFDAWWEEAAKGLDMFKFRYTSDDS